MSLYLYVGDKYPQLKSLINKHEVVVFSITEKFDYKYYEYQHVVYYDERKRREVVKHNVKEHFYNVNAYSVVNYDKMDSIDFRFLAMTNTPILSSVLKIKKMAFEQNFIECNEVNFKKQLRYLKLKKIEV